MVRSGLIGRLVLDWSVAAALVFSSWLCSGTASGQQKQAHALEFDISVLPETARYLELLAYPSYLAVALENNGLNPSLSSRVIIRDAESLHIKNADLQYAGKRGAIYTYTAKLGWSLGAAETSFRIPVEVDTSSAQQGKIRMVVHIPLAKYFPQELVDQISFKINSLANVSAQKKVLGYLDAIAARHGTGAVEGMFGQIMIDAYNRRSAGTGGIPGGREPGDAEPLSDQILLLMTLVIWLVIVPLAVTGQYFWHKFKRRRSESR